MSEWRRRVNRLLKRGVAGQPGELVDAQWLDPKQLAGPEWRHRNATDKVAGLVLGYHDDIAVGSTDNRHVLTVAGSRGGKGVSLIIPNLLLYDGSVLAIDPKGELAEITARARREKGQKVIILDPWGESQSGETGSYNPLDELDITSPGVIDDAGLIADGLITPSEREPHFTDSARILIKAIILYTLSLPKVDPKTKQPLRCDLKTVWQLLEGSHPMVLDVATRGAIGPRKALFKLLASCQAKAVDDAGNAVKLGLFNATVQAAGRNFAEVPDRELGSVYSTAMTQLEFLSSDRMDKVLASSDFRLSQLKTEKATLFLCLPATAMGTHARWLRVIINLAIGAFERTKVKPDIPVLMVLDEFAILGHMKSLEMAAGFMAGFDVKLWVVLQDLTQAQRLYKASWETFIGNAGVATFFSNSDKFTVNYLSDRLGQTTVTIDRPVELTSQQRFAGALGTREEQRVQRLAPPHELEQLLDRRNNTMLVLAAGQAPAVIERIIYHDNDPNFAGLYDERKQPAKP